MNPLIRLAPLVLLTLLAGVEISAQPAANPATVPLPRNDWMASHERFNTIARKGGVDLLFVGDSITAGWAGNGKALWAERYVPLKPANFGIGGDRTENVLWRLQNGNLDGIQPKVVVVMIGTNNVGRDTAPQIADGITSIVKEINTRLPDSKVLLLGVFPRAEQSDNWARTKLVEVNALISKLDDGKRVFFLDIGGKFIQPDGTITKDIMHDFLHLTPAGYQIWADAMQDKLAELVK
jgi:lysophospholipase L1-like esterase